MKLTRTEGAFVALVALLALAATLVPILDRSPAAGPGAVDSAQGETVTLHGRGPYRNMPADVAVQGLAQDLVTLGLAVPLLVAAAFWNRRGSVRSRVALAGVSFYFLVQYTMYLAMAAYNELFLVWTALAGLSLHLVVRAVLPFVRAGSDAIAPGAPRGTRRFVGIVLLVNGALIGLLWLSVIVPPLLDGSLYPAGLAHLTTMIVQGFDLAFFLPPSLMAGVAILRDRPAGRWAAPAYAVFLSLQMTALLAKIVWMSAVGASAGPALVLIPALLVCAVAAAAAGLRSLPARA
ncbi:MAG: hypothetical protein JXA15_12145 [Spirochaetales bacterium]|nr:hypothetical protein [Spirochaetales bacterium]